MVVQLTESTLYLMILGSHFLLELYPLDRVSEVLELSR